MADFKVSAEKITIFPHPKADRMDVAKVGMFSLVVNKENGYKTDDIVVFAPRRSLLPEDLRPHYINEERNESYLVGDNNDRVSSITLRGQLSEGVTLPLDWVLTKLGLNSVDDLEIGKDISKDLGITLWESPIPDELKGKVQLLKLAMLSQHDVEGMTIYRSNFQDGEDVFATEKLNGSQIAVIKEEDGTIHVSSKYLFQKGLEFIFYDQNDPAANLYWKAVYNTNLISILNDLFSKQQVQVFGEVIPVSGGNSYGYTRDKPSLRIYRLEVNEKRLGLAQAKGLSEEIATIWVPVLYNGPFDMAVLESYSKGKETLSGKSLHIREGVVIEPAEPRLAGENFPLYLKIINNKFVERDDGPG